MAGISRRIVLLTLVPALAAIGLAAVVTSAQAQEIDTIAVLVPEQGTDYGWNQQGVDAAKAVGAAMGIEVISAEGLGYGDVRPTLRELAAEGADLMIAHASGYNSAAPEIAAETNVAVAIVGQSRRRGGGPRRRLHGERASGRLPRRHAGRAAFAHGHARHRRLRRTAVVELAVRRIRHGGAGAERRRTASSTRSSGRRPTRMPLAANGSRNR